ncbi:hypothetical protein LOAG_07434 [Loa loa]|uniref:Uncharacterized protein n=1 Tax=Loa loa TaxID=7209 RepID=A0A1S0TVX2_LOALO|nr:hypothetical protein LOAG_07434 [Loa loa]EFO21053.1 hypothetical protein LOAG_07434 [Loa loa]
MGQEIPHGPQKYNRNNKVMEYSGIVHVSHFPEVKSACPFAAGLLLEITHHWNYPDGSVLYW